MKKSQSIFLLSGLVPLVAAPIAIVASCSGDTTTTAQTESGKEVARLNEVIKSNKLKIKDGIIFDEAKLTELKNTPDKLLTDYLDKTELNLDETKFTYNIDALSGVDQPKQAAAQPKTMNFKIKVTNKQTTSESALTEPATVSYQYQATAQPPTEQTPLEKAVANIEAEYDAKRFKLKADKAEISQDEITALKADPKNFLTEYTEGFPVLDNTLEAKVLAANFAADPKQSAPAGTPSVIKFKVTVSEKASKKEQLTKEFSFDFTLTNPPAPGPGGPGAGGGNF